MGRTASCAARTTTRTRSFAIEPQWRIRGMIERRDGVVPHRLPGIRRPLRRVAPRAAPSPFEAGNRRLEELTGLASGPVRVSTPSRGWRLKSSGSWHCRHFPRTRMMTGCPPTTRVVVVAFDGLQLLDLAGPMEVLRTATRLGATRPYRTLIATARGRRVRIRERHRPRRRRLARRPRPQPATRRHARSSSGASAAFAADPRPALPRRPPRRSRRRVRTRRLGLHGRVRARRRRPARRLRRHHALGVVRITRAAHHPTVDVQPRPHLRARPRPLDLGRRHRRHRPRCSPSSRTTTAPRSRTRSPAGSSCSPRRPGGQSQFSAQLRAEPRNDPVDRRAPALAPRPPRRRPRRRRPRRPRRHEPAQLRTRVPARDGRSRPPTYVEELQRRGGAPAARVERPHRGRGRRARRPPPRRDAAPGVPAPGRHHARPVPPALRPPRRPDASRPRGARHADRHRPLRGFTALDVIGPVPGLHQRARRRGRRVRRPHGHRSRTTTASCTSTSSTPSPTCHAPSPPRAAAASSPASSPCRARPSSTGSAPRTRTRR